MAEKRQVEVFSAGCPACEPVVALVKQVACASCDVIVRDMREPAAVRRATELGVHRVPAVVVNGQLAACCADRGIDEAALREAGVGRLNG